MQMMSLENKDPEIVITLNYEESHVPGRIGKKILCQVDIEVVGQKGYVYPYNEIGSMLYNICNQVLQGKTPADDEFFKVMSLNFFKHPKAIIRFFEE